MTQPSNERWLPVVGYEGIYEVSDHGRVRSVDRVVAHPGGDSARKGRVLKPCGDGRGYKQVNLWRDGSGGSVKVHRLVLEAFAGPCPDGMLACHTNGDNSDNRPSNLRWASQSDNLRDAVSHGTHHWAGKTHCPQGHPLVAPNLATSHALKSYRACLACSRARAHVQYNTEKKPYFQQVSDDYYARIAA